MMRITTFNVEGMSCSYCVMSVKKILNELDGVSNVEVHRDRNQVTVEYNDSTGASQTSIKEVIENAGYNVK